MQHQAPNAITTTTTTTTIKRNDTMVGGRLPLDTCCGELGHGCLLYNTTTTLPPTWHYLTLPCQSPAAKPQRKAAAGCAAGSASCCTSPTSLHRSAAGVCPGPTQHLPSSSSEQCRLFAATQPLPWQQGWQRCQKHHTHVPAVTSAASSKRLNCSGCPQSIHHTRTRSNHTQMRWQATSYCAHDSPTGRLAVVPVGQEHTHALMWHHAVPAGRKPPHTTPTDSHHAVGNQGHTTL